MATLADAVKHKVLEPYELPDWEHRLPIRPLLVAFEFWDWTDGKNELHDDKLSVGDRTLFESNKSFANFGAHLGFRPAISGK
jgi:hypothetical protein